MTWQVALTHETEKNLKKLPANIIQRVKDAIREIVANPLSGKPLRGNLKGQYSFRIGDYRMVYIPEEKHGRIYVLYVRHRRDAY
jgi:mRNA interferase RelE/StbE